MNNDTLITTRSCNEVTILRAMERFVELYEGKIRKKIDPFSRDEITPEDLFISLPDRKGKGMEVVNHPERREDFLSRMLMFLKNRGGDYCMESNQPCPTCGSRFYEIKEKKGKEAPYKLIKKCSACGAER